MRSGLAAVIFRRAPRVRFLATLVLIAVAATAWRVWIRPAPLPPSPTARAPVVVLVADFDNRTGNPVFDGTLQHALTLATEEASFIQCVDPRATALGVASRLKPGTAQIDEELGRLIAASRKGSG